MRIKMTRILCHRLHRGRGGAAMGNQLTVSAGVVPDVTTCLRELPDHDLDRIIHSTRFLKVCLRLFGNLAEGDNL